MVILFLYDSTISHIGFLLLALAINSEQSIDSFLFYILQYTLTNLNIFLIILALSYSNITLNNQNNYGLVEKGNKLLPAFVYDLNYISEFKGLFFSNPFLSLSLAVSLFSMAGIPPLIGFFSKQFVLYSSMQNGYYFISIIAIIVSVISASYYLKIIKLLFTQPSEGAETETTLSQEKEINHSKEELSVLQTRQENNNVGVESPLLVASKRPEVRGYLSTSVITNTHSFIISSLTLTIILFFIKPSLFLNSTQLLSLSLFFN